MIREDLGNLTNEKRRKFTGIFVRWGKKSGWRCTLDTVLLSNIIDVETNKIVSDHLWFNKTKEFERIEKTLKNGDTVEFIGRVGEYEKGWKGSKAWKEGYGETETDYKIERPTKIKKILELK